jgi:hypothetical protein
LSETSGCDPLFAVRVRQQIPSAPILKVSRQLVEDSSPALDGAPVDTSPTFTDNGITYDRETGEPADPNQCPALWEGNDTVEGLQDKFPCELPRGHDGDHQYTARWNEENHFLPGRNPDGTGRLVYSRVS